MRWALIGDLLDRSIAIATVTKARLTQGAVLGWDVLLR
jgi:hypothetical protein